jgi:hypothetical protein
MQYGTQYNFHPKKKERQQTLLPCFHLDLYPNNYTEYHDYYGKKIFKKK